MPRKLHQNARHHYWARTKEGKRHVLKHHRAHLYEHVAPVSQVKEPIHEDQQSLETKTSPTTTTL